MQVLQTFNFPDRNEVLEKINKRADRFTEIALWVYFAIGLLLAFEYDTWVVAIIIGSACQIGYYATKKILPEKSTYKYVGSAVFAIYMAQFIYQMHGMFEMHFFAFVGCTILIAHNNWKVQIPLIITVAIHHALFGYLQFKGNTGVYFTQLEYMTLKVFIIHCILAVVIVGICAYWAYHNDNNVKDELAQNEALKQLRKTNLELIQSISKNDFSFMEIAKNTHNIDPLFQGLIEMSKSIMQYRKNLEYNQHQLKNLIHALSHDLKTPARGVKMVAEWMETDLLEGDTSQFDENIQKLKVNSKNIYDKLESLRVYLNIGLEKWHPEKVDLNFVVEQIRRSLQKENITIKTNNLGVISSKFEYIQILLYHLIENGVVHNNNALPYISLERINSKDKKYIVLEYQDNGVGLTQSAFEKLRILFKSNEKAYDNLRTGIGLTLIDKILSEIKGKIKYVPCEEGLKLHITLPV